jgi:hypothetical protein
MPSTNTLAPAASNMPSAINASAPRRFMLAVTSQFFLDYTFH